MCAVNKSKFAQRLSPSVTVVWGNPNRVGSGKGLASVVCVCGVCVWCVVCVCGGVGVGVGVCVCVCVSDLNRD